ncbi:vWA domain-containing protein [Modestobacter versicolor]|uniref:vWA domain-containing protein n=1 Tax=Modestobacter versicolor TaxID=429133 RepID=UPI0034DE8B91
MAELLDERQARRTGRDELDRAHPEFQQVSPQLGELDEEALADLAGRDPDQAARLLTALGRAFDPGLRRAARALAARLPVTAPRTGVPDRSGSRRVVTRRDPTGSDVDLDATLAARGAEPHWRAEHLHTRGWRATGRACVLVVDASGSVAGDELAAAVLTASALAQRMRPGDELAVVAFWSTAVVLQPLGAGVRPDVVIDRLFDLKGGGTTNLDLALRTAGQQLARTRTAARDVLLLSDGMPTDSPDPRPAAAALVRAGARLSVLGLSAAPESVENCTALAAAGGGRAAALHRPSQAPAAVRALLD